MRVRLLSFLLVIRIWSVVMMFFVDDLCLLDESYCYFLKYVIVGDVFRGMG